MSEIEKQFERWWTKQPPNFRDNACWRPAVKELVKAAWVEAWKRGGDSSEPALQIG